MLFDQSVLVQTLQAYLPFLSYLPAQVQHHVRSMHLDLTPVFDSTSHEAEALNIRLSLEAPCISANSTLVELQLSYGNVPSQRYDGESLEALDDNGRLDLTIWDDERQSIRRWLPQRETEGDVVLAMRALPRHVDINTPIGPRSDLRKQHGGLLGAGMLMLPSPPTPDEVYDITVTWNSTGAPPETQIASSLGEGVITKVRSTLQAIQLSVFAVGPLRRFPADISESPDFAILYFDPDPPFDIPDLASFIQALFANMSAFFRNKVQQPYRIFLRSSPRAVGGAGFLDSFMLEYHHDQTVTQTETKELLTHEVVHNWPLMECTAGHRAVVGADCGWYSEGIATYYQSHLPYRFNLTNRPEFVRSLNGLAQAYYTNPTIGYDNEEASAKAWQDPEAQRLPYHRGMMYLTSIDSQIREASQGRKGVDDTVFELLERRRAGQRYDLRTWLDLVEVELGASAVDDYERMANGTLVVPSRECLAQYGLELVRHDQERFELGFDPTISFNTRRISGLVAGSRAAAAGIADGDELVGPHTLLWQAADDIERNMTMTMTANYAPNWPQLTMQIPASTSFGR
ncbi:hypothetical protein LTR65_005244 [Meristemomyces frigidus]